MDSCYTSPDGITKRYPKPIQRINAAEILWLTEKSLGDLGVVVEIIKLRWIEEGEGVAAIFEAVVKAAGKDQFQVVSGCGSESPIAVESITRIVRKIVEDQIKQLHNEERKWRDLLKSSEAPAS